MGYVALCLGEETGADVMEWISSADKREPDQRTSNFVESLCETGTLTGELRVPDTIAAIEIVVDLRAQQIELALEVDAPSDMTARGRVGWLKRQLRDAPGDLTIEAYAKWSQTCTSALLAKVKDDSTILQREDRKAPDRFRIVWRSDLRQGRTTRGRKPGFAHSVTAAVERFYHDVLQEMTPYQKKAPKLSVSALVDDTEMS